MYQEQEQNSSSTNSSKNEDTYLKYKNIFGQGKGNSNHGSNKLTRYSTQVEYNTETVIVTEELSSRDLSREELNAYAKTNNSLQQGDLTLYLKGKPIDLVSKENIAVSSTIAVEKIKNGEGNIKHEENCINKNGDKYNTILQNNDQVTAKYLSLSAFSQNQANPIDSIETNHLEDVETANQNKSSDKLCTKTQVLEDYNEYNSPKPRVCEIIHNKTSLIECTPENLNQKRHQLTKETAKTVDLKENSACNEQLVTKFIEHDLLANNKGANSDNVSDTVESSIYTTQDTNEPNSDNPNSEHGYTDIENSNNLLKEEVVKLPTQQINVGTHTDANNVLFQNQGDTVESCNRVNLCLKTEEDVKQPFDTTCTTKHKENILKENFEIVNNSELSPRKTKENHNKIGGVEAVEKVAKHHNINSIQHAHEPISNLNLKTDDTFHSSEYTNKPLTEKFDDISIAAKQNESDKATVTITEKRKSCFSQSSIILEECKPENLSLVLIVDIDKENKTKADKTCCIPIEETFYEISSQLSQEIIHSKINNPNLDPPKPPKRKSKKKQSTMEENSRPNSAAKQLSDNNESTVAKKTNKTRHTPENLAKMTPENVNDFKSEYQKSNTPNSQTRNTPENMRGRTPVKQKPLTPEHISGETLENAKLETENGSDMSYKDDCSNSTATLERPCSESKRLPSSQPQSPIDNEKAYSRKSSKARSHNLRKSRSSSTDSHFSSKHDDEFCVNRATAILASVNRAQTPDHKGNKVKEFKRGTLTRSDSIKSIMSNADSRHSSQPHINTVGIDDTYKSISTYEDIKETEELIATLHRRMPLTKEPMINLSGLSMGPSSMYKSIQCINKAGADTVQPVRPPRRSKTSMGFSKVHAVKNYEGNDLQQGHRTKENSANKYTDNSNQEDRMLEKVPNIKTVASTNMMLPPSTKGTLERSVSEYKPEKIQEPENIKYSSETQLASKLKKTEMQITSPSVLKSDLLPQSKSTSLIPRTRSERFLESGETLELNLSENDLANNRSLSMLSGLTERSETMSELTQLSTCTSEQTVFSARGTVIQRRTAEESTERWIKDIIASQNDFHLRGLLTCCFCKNPFEKPVILSNCLHSYCKQCINCMDKVKSENRMGYNCFMCGIFSIEDTIRNNIFFEELLDIEKITTEGVSSVCRQCPDGLEPTWKCIDCKLDLCEKCHTIHLMIPLLQSHKVVNLTNPNEIVIDRLVFCHKHVDEPIKFNCLECEQVLCIKCKVTEHDIHKMETVDIALKRLLPEVRMHTEALEQNLQNLRDKIKEVDYKIEVTKDMYAKCSDDIDRKAEEEIAKIRKTQEQLKSSLTERKNIEMDLLFNFMTKMQNKQNEGNNLRDLVTIAIMRGRQMSLLAEVQNGLYSKVRYYKIEIQKESSIQTAHPDLSENTKVGDLFDEGFLGKVNYHTIKVLSSGTIPSYKRFLSIKFEEYFSNQFQQILTLNLPDQCLSVTLVNDRIWGAFPYINAIQIYDCQGDFIRTHTYECYQPRAIHQTTDGDVIMACQFTGLYILDNESANVLFQIATGKFSDICLRDDRIYALEYNLKKVLIFSKSDMTTSNCCGSKWSAISTVIDISQVQQIDSVTTLLVHEQYDDHFYICSYNSHAIFHFNQRSELIGKYGHKGRQGAGELFYPMLCSIDKFGFLLLADGENKRLQILDIWGMWRSLEFEGLRKPYNATMDIKKDLWITQFNDQYQSWQLIKYSDEY